MSLNLLIVIVFGIDQVTFIGESSGAVQVCAFILEGFIEREADVITLYFGLNGEHSMTLEEIGEKFNLTRERVRQIKEKAIRRLRHTSRSKALKPYLG